MPLQSLDNITQPRDRIIGALDYDGGWPEAHEGMSDFGPAIGLGKVNSIADRTGLDHAVQTLAGHGMLTMIDYKYNDIDDTMRRRVREATLAGGSMITVMASNPVKALQEALKGVEQALAVDSTLIRPWLLGVTVLTSIDDKEVVDGKGRPIETCTSIFGADRKAKVRQFAHQSADAGFQAIVCSPQEAEMLSNDPYTQHLLRVIPALRPAYAVTKDEQATAATPRIAFEAGADFGVFGRPLINAASYGMTGREAADYIAEEIGAVK